MAGVGAGTGALTSLLGKLTALLGDEYTLLAGVRKEAEFLQRELGAMQGLLETLADKPRLDPQEKLLKGNVRELTYAIEDCVDRFVLRLGSSGGGDADSGFIKDTVRRLKTLRRRHELATQFKDLKALVMEESQRRERYRLDNRGQSSSGSVVELDPRLPALYAEAKGLVAIDGPRDRVVSWLAEKSVDLKVVAIVGGGGLGKTTLAMEAYRKITGSFECRASVSVSRTLDLGKLLKDVLSQVDEDVFRKCQKERWENEQLIRQTRKFFTGKRLVTLLSKCDELVTGVQIMSKSVTFPFLVTRVQIMSKSVTFPFLGVTAAYVAC